MKNMAIIALCITLLCGVTSCGEVVQPNAPDIGEPESEEVDGELPSYDGSVTSKIFRTRLLCYNVRNCKGTDNVVDYKRDITSSDLIALEEEFKEFLSNDFNTANAITAIQKVLKLINAYSRTKEFDAGYACELLTLLDKEMWVLGIDSKIEVLNEENLSLVRDWTKARNDKNFELADQYRQRIIERGIVL